MLALDDVLAERKVVTDVLSDELAHNPLAVPLVRTLVDVARSDEGVALVEGFVGPLSGLAEDPEAWNVGGSSVTEPPGLWRNCGIPVRAYNLATPFSEEWRSGSVAMNPCRLVWVGIVMVGAPDPCGASTDVAPVDQVDV